ncbi:hypothetical protein AND_008090 [Anopheles darlingi]|uniref:Uncharacterized protein n=1 Tax=Anopheles darlingi TaxID=43151 RepID=W5J750_ANODA|nr:hypothetical protein AND_008090 [Anopheles darlingi]
MTPKPEEGSNIPVVHAVDERELSGSLNNSSLSSIAGGNSMGNLSNNLKLSAFINNGFVGECPAGDKPAIGDTQDELRKDHKNSQNGGIGNGGGGLGGGGGGGGANANPAKMAVAVAEKPVVDFDDLLPHVGEFGRYQKILFLLMIPFAFFVAFVYFSQIFITLVPEEHWCYVPELQHLSVEQSSMALSGFEPVRADRANGEPLLMIGAFGQSVAHVLRVISEHDRQ